MKKRRPGQPEDRQPKLKAAPGQGEQAAQSGYVQQYALSARVIYEALAKGTLSWIGVAHLDAEAFDDIVLGLGNRIVGYQVKTRQDAKRFSIKTILLGAEGLLGKILASRDKLLAANPNTLIEIVYACDDEPLTNDDVGGGVSSAALLQAHKEHRLSWSLVEWKASSFGGFVTEVQRVSGREDHAFATIWRDTRFVTKGQGHFLGLGPNSPADETHLRKIADELPHLAAEKVDKLPVGDLLARVGIYDPFRLKHTHRFPVDVLYQSNAATEEALQKTLATITLGYVGLVGPPGSGKSTLLAAGLLPTPRAVVIRYLAFVPDVEQGVGRAEAIDFLGDLVRHLKRQGLGNSIVPGSAVDELRTQFQSLLIEASARFSNEGVRTLIVIDGLDHVSREEKPQRSFLCELPQSHAIPEGVVIVLGTQKLDLDDLPPSVRDQAQEVNRRVDVAALSREAVSCMAAAACVPEDVDRGTLYDRTIGHPLSVRYAIEALKAATTPDARKEWIDNGPAYGGDVEVFYKRAWHGLSSNVDAKTALRYLALAEGPISPESLKSLVGLPATESAWGAAGHLLVKNHQKAWSIFHNSFRLFLGAQVGTLHGESDEKGIQDRYARLADMARGVGKGDPQRWLELRYRARAKDWEGVAGLAKPEGFRAQFIEGRSPGDINTDITLAFKTAGALRLPGLVIDLIFARHELAVRCEALGDDIFDTRIDLGDLREALGLLRSEAVTLTPGSGFKLVDEFMRVGNTTEARLLFEELEPLDILLGTKTPRTYGVQKNVLFEWAERALMFRKPEQILASLARIREPEDTLGQGFDLGAYRTRIALEAAKGQLTRYPASAIDRLMLDLSIGQEYRTPLLHFAAYAAFESDNCALAVQHLEGLRESIDELDPRARRRSAVIAAQVDRLDLATCFFEGTPAPTLAERRFGYGAEDICRAVLEIVDYSALAARLGRLPVDRTVPASRLFAAFQTRLEVLGRLLGEGRRGSKPSVEPAQEFHDLMEFLERAGGSDRHDSDRRQLDEAVEETVRMMVQAAAFLGAETFQNFTKDMDARLANDAPRLGQPKVRRAYARAVFRHEGDASQAQLRLAYRPGQESSPADQHAEAAKTASTLAAIGLDKQAREILDSMHEDGLGYSRPAKKDPQYSVWEDLFVRACEEDSAGRTARVRFFGRLLAGMSKTEGDGAGRRLVPAFLSQAAQVGATWARAAADRVEGLGLASWPELVEGLLAGVATRRSDLTGAAGIVYGRIVVPFDGGRKERNERLYAKLIRVAPAAQVESLTRHALVCLETDGHPTKRTTLLEQVVDAAALRGFVHGADILARWRGERPPMPPPRSGMIPDDTSFLDRTLEEITGRLQNRSENSNNWSARQAFHQVAPTCKYDAVKVVFDSSTELQEDDRAIEVMVHLAHAAGRKADTFSYLRLLKNMAAGDDCSWGDGWRSIAKQRYHRLNVMLNGEAAGRTAFDAFVDDMGNQRESAYVLPELCDVLEFLSPRPSWAETWASLEEHLRHFREYRMGEDFEPLAEGSDDEENILADVIFRAIDTTSIELMKMARSTAIELSGSAEGANVVAALLPRLWKTGGVHALQASQIAWECRETISVRDSVLTFLHDMCDSEDVAVRRTAGRLAREWGQLPPIKRAVLPAIYALTLPQRPQADRFEPPSGTSATSSGLYTEDPYAWTWPLGHVMEIAVRATKLGLANLRVRAAQIMDRAGGTAAFGPEAEKRQVKRLRHLDLQTKYEKLLVVAAFQAAREMIGELESADAIDPEAIPFILPYAAAFPDNVATLPPVPRPPGVMGMIFPAAYRPAEGKMWRDAVDQNAVKPTIDGHIVLAASAIHTRRDSDGEWIEEQYFGPNIGEDAGALIEHLARLPRVSVTGRAFSDYPGLAPGAVVHARPDLSGAIAPLMLTLCPSVAEKIGWQADPRNAFTYLDADGHVIAQTIFWRDGGVWCRNSDDAVFSHGHVLVVREDRTNDIRPYLSRRQVQRAWRTIQGKG